MIATSTDELDIFLNQSLKELEQIDGVDFSKIGRDELDLDLQYPITPESLSPGSETHETDESFSTLLKFFSTLKTNYLRLCNSYNMLLLKLSDCEMDRVSLYQENMELKKLLKYMLDSNGDNHKGRT